MDYTIIVCQILIAWIYGHFLEYFAHRFYLHGRYRAAKSAFASHFKNHHFASRKNRMKDKKYATLRFDLRGDFEQRALLILATIHFPVVFVFPYAYLTLLLSSASYYIIHHLVHRYPGLGRKYFPWHYSHHLALDQHQNWGVRLPIVDYIFGTSVKYVGTDKETNDILKYVSRRREEHAIRSCSNSSDRYQSCD